MTTYPKSKDREAYDAEYDALHMWSDIDDIQDILASFVDSKYNPNEINRATARGTLRELKHIAKYFEDAAKESARVVRRFEKTYLTKKK